MEDESADVDVEEDEDEEEEEEEEGEQRGQRLLRCLSECRRVYS